MRSGFKFIVVAFLASILSLPATAQESTLDQNDVLNYLEQLINWQRDAVALDPSADNAREVIFQDTLKQNSLRVLQSGFKFARAEAARQSQAHPEAEDNAQSDTPTPRQRMAERAAQTDARISQINTRLGQIDTLLPTSKGPARDTLVTEQKSLQDELKLSQAKQELFQTVLANMTAATTGEAKGFLGKINNLASTIPELSTTPAKPAKEATKAQESSGPSSFMGMPLPASAPAAPAAAAPRPVTSILSLGSDLFDATRQQRTLADFVAQTNHLQETSKGLMKSLRTALDDKPAPADAETTADGEVVAVPAPAPVSIDEKVAEFKKIAADIVPLGDANMWIGASLRSIEDWQKMLDKQVHTLLRSLLIHLGILAITLAIPLVLSSILKRAIIRYVPDPKRQRQAQTARRIVTWLIVFFIVLQNFISDFSSFATFAGFLTAGLAVALQSVLLSLVAHFFFYGRYGVRNGDRVNVAGVTGEILQIGIMRFYLRELDKDFKPTGKVVAFPNSILFQPSAFYKYV